MSVIENPIGIESFQDLLQEIFEISLKDDALTVWRSKAWDRFLELGLLTSKSDSYKYVPLKQLYQQSFQLAEKPLHDIEGVSDHIFEECKDANIVFIDGFYSAKYSNFSAVEDQLVILPMKEAMQSYGVLMQNLWNKVLCEEQDAFCLLNMAMQNDGLFIYVPKNQKLRKTLQVVHIMTSTQSPRMIFPRIEMFLGANAQMQMVYTGVSEGNSKDWCNEKWGCVLEENAHLEILDACTVSEDSFYTNHIRAQQKKDSLLRVLSFSDGGKFTRNDYQTNLMESGSHVDFIGLWMLRKKRQHHAHIQVKHTAPHCTSSQFFKGIVHEESKSSFEGKIFVESEAQKTEAYQLNRNLVLSDDAKAFSKPNLEIFADDVKASHGATVSQLSDESLFYLQSRGLSKSAARSLVMKAFWNEVLDRTADSSWKTFVKKRCEELSKNV